MKKIFFLLSFICFVSTASLVFAQDLQYEMVSYTANNKDASTPFFNLAFFNKPTFTINYTSFSSGFQFLFDLVIGVSIATAVILFMIAALKEITGRGDIKQIESGKKGMQNAIIGLMIVLSTWLIINTINPDLVRLPMFSNLDKLGNSTGGGGATRNSNVDLRSNETVR